MLARLNFFVLLAGFAASSFAAVPMQYVLAKDQSKIEFIAHTKNADVKGTFSDFSVTVQSLGTALVDTRVKVSVTSSSLSTQNRSRDEHLRSEDFLWAAKYPTATFETTKLAQKSQGTFQVEGIFSFRGVTKNISFETRMEQSAENQISKVLLKGEFTLNRQDFGISYQPFFLLPRIKDEVQVRFELTAIAKTPETSS